MLAAKFIYRRLPDLKVLAKREVHRSYYDLLGLTPKASQVDIKNAYYKKSMLYHPDKGEGDPERFREITTAYEVLGNLKLRKMYDRGLLPISGGLPKVSEAEMKEADKPEPPPHTAGHAQANQHFYKANASYPDLDEELRKKRKAFTGKTKEYDFDAWTQAHYTESFAKQETSKRYRREREEQDVDTKLKKADLIFTTFFFSCVALIVLHLQRNKNQDFGRQWKPK